MTIYKKLFRDLLEHKGANFAAIIVIAIGIMLFSGASKTMDDIYFSKLTFYQECVFPDVYASVIAAPMTFDKSFNKPDTIKSMQGRIIEDVKVLNTHKTLRLISITNDLAKYNLMEGNRPSNHKNELLIDNLFASANNLHIGDQISIISGGNVSHLKISGIARSAENIFAMKDETTIFSDPKEFGLAFVDLNIIKSITGKNSFNEIIFTLQNEVTFNDVKDILEKELENYSLIRLYEKKDQTSNIVVDGEIKELKTTMIFMPGIFLMVAALVMSIMIKRIIAQQRGQIGVLKAFGYSDFAVGFHYASYVIVIGVIGGILGSIMGMFFSTLFLNLYKTLFNMEFIDKFTPTSYFIKGTLLSSIFCVITGIFASQKALSIQPAEAMRQEAPQSGQKSIIEKLPFFDMIFDSRGKMAIRNLTRNKNRSFFIIIGLSFAFAISTLPLNMLTLIDDIILNRFKYVEKYDIKMVTNSLMSKEAAERELSKLTGISYSEGIINIPAKLKYHGIVRDIPVIGISSNSKLYNIVDNNNHIINMNNSGITLSKRLAEKLEIKVGDNLLFKSPYSKYKTDETTLIVNNIVPQNIGMNAYMNIEFLSKTLGYQNVCNNLLIKTNSDDTLSELNTKYEDANKVKTIQSKQETINQIKHRMNSMYSAIYFMVFIAMTMSFAIIYNIYLVVILERKREFSTLMVLGMDEQNILSIISLEQVFSAILAVMLGIPIAQSLIKIMSIGLSTDMFTIPSYINIFAIIGAMILLTCSIIMAKSLASKKIHTIDIVEALKSGE